MDVLVMSRANCTIEKFNKDSLQDIEEHLYEKRSGFIVLEQKDKGIRVEDFYDAHIKDRISKDAIVRSNSIYLVDIVSFVSEPDCLTTMNEVKLFIQNSYNFFKDRYGNKIIYAIWHKGKDKNYPKNHLHIGLVPVTNEKRLSARSIFDRSELFNMRKEYRNYMNVHQKDLRIVSKEEYQKNSMIEKYQNQIKEERDINQQLDKKIQEKDKEIEILSNRLKVIKDLKIKKKDSDIETTKSYELNMIEVLLSIILSYQYPMDGYPYKETVLRENIMYSLRKHNFISDEYIYELYRNKYIEIRHLSNLMKNKMIQLKYIGYLYKENILQLENIIYLVRTKALTKKNINSLSSSKYNVLSKREALIIYENS